MFRNGILAIVLLALWASAGNAAASAYKEVRDWIVSCTDGLTCSLSYSDYDSQVVQFVSLERTAAPDAPVSLSIALGEPIRAGENGVETLFILVDGVETLSLPLTDASIENDGRRIDFNAVDAIGVLLEAMIAGTDMLLRLGDGETDSSLDVSLSGVTAGLLFIDEAQERLQRSDALLDVGPRPAPDRAPARDLASIDDLPAMLRSDFQPVDAPCGGRIDENGDGLGAFSVEIGDGRHMIGAPCGLGGAYNQPFVLYVGEGDAFRQLPFPIMTDDGPSTSSMEYNIDFSRREMRLTAFFKGRGIGDCGSYQVWTLADNGYEAALTLIEQRIKGDCDGDYAGGPENWPQVWPQS